MEMKYFAILFSYHETRLKIQSLSLQVVKKSIIWIVNWCYYSREKNIFYRIYLCFVLYKYFGIMTRIILSLWCKYCDVNTKKNLRIKLFLSKIINEFNNIKKSIFHLIKYLDTNIWYFESF